MTRDLLIAYYGDDFTGSTDVLESLTMNGVPTVLFLEPPTPERLARFPEAMAVGLAGVSRGQSPQWMDERLPALFASLKALGARLYHYKVCSTFDSAPDVGSIGRALDIGARVFGTSTVPVVVGAPALRRYQVFGNLFATVDDTTFRIDRHPTMSRHPVTPMDEADLRLHLGRQTGRSMALMDILSLWAEDYEARHQRLMAEVPGVLFHDVADTRSLERAGQLVWDAMPPEGLFCVGSSGLEYALVAHWGASGRVPLAPPERRSAGAVDRLMVVSGSCSPVTAEQIRHALDSGFAGCEIDPGAVIDPITRAEAIEGAVEACTAELAAGRSVIAYSAIGAPGPRTRELFRRDPAAFTEGLGDAQGRILRETVKRAGLSRVVVAGGDTSGSASRHLELYALTVAAPIAPGGPLCTGHSDDSRLDGLEIALKGGQIGGRRYFEQVRRGEL